VASKYSNFTTMRKDGAILGPWSAWLHDPDLGYALWGATNGMTRFRHLPEMTRQIVILTVGSRFGAAYEIDAISDRGKFSLGATAHSQSSRITFRYRKSARINSLQEKIIRRSARSAPSGRVASIYKYLPRFTGLRNEDRANFGATRPFVREILHASSQREVFEMPVAKIHVHEGAFKDSELAAIGTAVQAALEEVLSVPPEDHFRITHVLPKMSS
jgi:hypothetical protein